MSTIWSLVKVKSLAAALLVILAVCLNAPAAVLVKDGQAHAVLVLSRGAHGHVLKPFPKIKRWEPKGPNVYEKLAAMEIYEHLLRMSGARLRIVEAGSDLQGLTPIYIGQAADEALEASIRQKGTYPGSFAIVVTPKRVSIRGLSGEGTLFGAYELLEQLGVRWYMPGELGAVVPQHETVELREQRTIQVPSFRGRCLQGVRATNWELQMRLGGTRFPSSHGVDGLAGDDAARVFKEHPEWFSLIEGVRKNRQLCFSNPAVIKHAIEVAKAYFRNNPDAEIMGMGPNEGRNFCQCERCQALDSGDVDPFGHEKSVTDRVVWFLNKVLEGIEDEFPDKKLGFYAYSVYNRPPVKIKPNPRIVPAVALITLCRVHGFSNPICPEKSYEQQIIRGWGKLVPEVFYRGYWYNLADPGLPFYVISRVREEIPLGKELGIAGWRVETLYEWAASCPSRYLAAKLMWDHTVDVDGLLAEFYEKFFGPAAKPMQRYIETMDMARHDSDCHTGSIWDAPHIYNQNVRTIARRALDRAQQLATDGLYAKRVWMCSRSFAYLDAFVKMIQSRAVHDYVTSKKALDEITAIRGQLEAHDPPLIGRKAKSYLQRFYSGATEDGYRRTTGGNELVAGLDDQWMFQIDPEEIGEAIGWWRPQNIGGNWKPIKTSTCSWSQQGLRYYKGLAWYRQNVRIPQKFAGRRISLWFGAVDEHANVWVNGNLIGSSLQEGGTLRPFEFDVTDVVQPGKTNCVVVCVTNKKLNELGTGGLLAPVMFYAPAEGSESLGKADAGSPREAAKAKPGRPKRRASKPYGQIQNSPNSI